MKIYLSIFTQLIINIIYVLVSFTTFPSPLTGYFGDSFFPLFVIIFLIINGIFLSVHIRDYILKKISLLQMFIPIIFFVVLVVLLFGKTISSSAVTIRDSVIAKMPNKSQENIIKLINDCEVAGILIDGDRVKILLKNQWFTYASSKDYGVLRDALKSAQNKCH